jgi:ankyrin repeat protein
MPRPNAVPARRKLFTLLTACDAPRYVSYSYGSGQWSHAWRAPLDLVNQGASANVLAADGSTLLHLFCRRFANATPVKLAMLFATHPAQRAAIDGRGRTPLHCLVSFAADLTPEVLTPLIGDGVAATVVDADGRTPLHAACADRPTVRHDVLALLVAAHPAAREQRDATGASPLAYALQRVAALGPASIALLAPGWRERRVAAVERPGAPCITTVETHGSVVWLSLSPPADGYADGGGARMLWYRRPCRRPP